MTDTDPTPPPPVADPLAAARGLITAVLHDPRLPAEVVLDLCDTLNQLDLPGLLPTHPDRQPPPGTAPERLRQARLLLRAGVPDLPDPAGCRALATAIRFLDAAATGLAAAGPEGP